MLELEYVIKIISYVIIVALFYGGTHIKSPFQSWMNFGNRTGGIINCVVCSILLGIYSLFVSGSSGESDRFNYITEFYGKDPRSMGLSFVFCLLHMIGGDFEALFFTVAFVCTLLTFWGLWISEDGYKEAALLILCSDYLLNNLYMFKQVFAMAFGFIAFVLLLKNKYVLCFLCVVIAICFHMSAWMLFPLFFLCIISKNQWIRYGSYIFFVGLVLFFSDMSRSALDFCTKFLPYIATRLNEHYFDSSGNLVIEYNYLTILKGIPYYLIFLFGLYKRKLLKDKISNYDSYLAVSFYASIFILLSMYSYWMFRFAVYCYVPMFIFASELFHSNTNWKETIAFEIIIFSSLSLLTLKYLFQIFFKYGGWC